jgi:hypothetical protein
LAQQLSLPLDRNICAHSHSIQRPGQKKNYLLLPEKHILGGRISGQ